MAQINIDNVLQVYRLFDERVAELRASLTSSAKLRDIPACADDPVSQDARRAFQPKIDAILDTHTAYLAEIVEARDRLKEAARSYGLVDDDTATSFSEGSSGRLPGRWNDR